MPGQIDGDRSGDDPRLLRGGGAIELAGAQQRLSATQVKLLAARVARKGVETLKERQRRRWLMEQDRRETAAIDDLNVMRAGRRGDPEPGA